MMGDGRFAICLLVFVFACTSQPDKGRIAQLEKQVSDLQVQLKQQKETATLDLQEKCAKQARSEFNQLGWGKDPTALFTNHYNAKLNKCFMEIQNTDLKTSPGDIFTNRTLFDAFEGKPYGQYIWKSDDVKKYWEVPPKYCRLYSEDGKEQLCHSTEEYEAWVKKYMED
jgi:hypothetical protein